MKGLSRLANARTRAITPENRDGAKGAGARAGEGMGAAAARELGVGWKVAPCERIAPGDTLVLADAAGPGVVNHVWMTLTGSWRRSRLRVYWDGADEAAIDVPAGDFFCQGFDEFCQVSALPVNVNPASGFNCFWEMPFRARMRMTLENSGDDEVIAFWQVDYEERDVPDDTAYLHAAWRRSSPVVDGLHVILDGVRGRGHYVGTYLAWEAADAGWWGEGEVKHYLDGDGEHPTICGTGTEDYFGGSYGFAIEDEYRTFTAPYLGLPQVLCPRGPGGYPRRFGLYRFHVPDPIRFETDLRVTVQALGWNEPACDRYRLRADDVASTALWYQAT
jgi:hypothetical protein